MMFNIGMLNASRVKAMRPCPWERDLMPSDQARALRQADELGFWKVGMPEHFAIHKGPATAQPPR